MCKSSAQLGSEFLLYIIIIVILTAIDQITKIYMRSAAGGVEAFSIPVIGDFFHLTYVENHGGIFGIFQGKISVFTILSIVVIAYLIYSERKNIKNYTKWTKIGIAFITSGAIGNMTDRIMRGYVIDMLDFRGIWHFVFNFADVFINVGVGIIILDYLVKKMKSRRE